MNAFARARALSLVAVIAALFAACSIDLEGTGIQDDTSFELALLGGDAVHSPYATGAVFRVWPNGEEATEERWRIRSTDPSVIRVDPAPGASRQGEGVATAVAAGQAQLRIVDEDGEIVHRVNVEVRDPDAVTVSVAGSVVEGEALVFAGSTVPLRGEATGGDIALAGSPAFVVEPASLVTTDSLGVAQLGPIPAGETQITLRVGVLEQTLTVRGVEAAEIATVRVARLPMTDDQMEDGATGLVAASAWSADDRAIAGVPFTWSVGDDTMPSETGGQLWYTYSAVAEERPATARIGDREASLVIRMADGTTPIVQDPIALDCSAAPGEHAGSTLLASVALGLLGVAAWRRRGKRA